MQKFSLFISAMALAFSALVTTPTVYANEEFSIDLKTSKSVVEQSQLFIYTITVRNTGTEDPVDPILTLSLDKDTDFESASNDGRSRRDSVEWKDFSLPPGTSKTFNASVRVGDSAEDSDDLFATAFIGNAFAEASVEVKDEDDVKNNNERAIVVELFSNKAQVEPTEPFTFVVRASNNGDNKVKGTDITVELAEGIEFLSAANKGKSSGNKIVWSNLEFDGDETRTFTASVRVTNDIAHQDGLTSIVYSEGSVHEHKIQVWDPHDGQEFMEVHAFTNNDEVEAGESIEYTVRVKNLADHDERIDIRAWIDSKTIFASASDGGVQYDRTLVQWDDVSFKQSEMKAFTLSVTAKEDILSKQNLRFAAKAGRGRKEVVSSVKPNASGATVLANRAAAEAVAASPLVIQQTADASETQPGSLIRFTVSLQHTGTEKLENIEVLEQFPNGTLSVQETDGGNSVQNGVLWTIGELLPGQTWSKTYTATVTGSASHGTLLQRNASVTSNGTLIADARSNNTGVISKLPQAGFGTFSLAMKESHKFLTLSKAHANEPKTVKKPVVQKKSASKNHVYLWILIILGGSGTGMLVGRKIID